MDRKSQRSKIATPWLTLIATQTILIGVSVLFFGMAVSGILSGAVHCGYKNCSAYYQLASDPAGYWFRVVVFSMFALFFLWLAAYAALKFFRSRRSEA